MQVNGELTQVISQPRYDKADNNNDDDNSKDDDDDDEEEEDEEDDCARWFMWGSMQGEEIG